MQRRLPFLAATAFLLMLAGGALVLVPREAPKSAGHDAQPSPGEVRADGVSPGAPAAATSPIRTRPPPTRPTLHADREALLAALYASSNADDSLLGARLTLGRNIGAFDPAVFLTQAYGLAADDPVALAQVARVCMSPVGRQPTVGTAALHDTCWGLDVVERLLALEAGNAWVHMLEAVRLDTLGGDPAPALRRARDAVYFDDFDDRARLRILETVARTTPADLVEVVTRQAFAAHAMLEVLAPLGPICLRSADAESSCLAAADYFERARRPGARAVYLHLAEIDDPSAANLPLTLDQYGRVMARMREDDGLTRLLDDLARYEVGSALRLAGERYGMLQGSSWEPEPLGVTVIDSDDQ